MPNYDDLFASPAPAKEAPTDLPAFDKETWVGKKQQERSDAYTLIDDTALKMACNGELFQTYLDVQARFDRYSVGNAILITAQKPEATKLADFDKWKEDGAYVNKGETGITLLEPGNEYEREDGSTGVSYNAKKVFDVSQTNAKQKAAPVITRDERLLLKALINDAPCQLSISENLPDNVNAVYKPDSKTILIRQGMDAQTIFRSLVNELAHAYMDKGDYKRSECSFNAYCSAYILCKRNGISVDTFSFDRMPETVSKMDASAMRKQLAAIRDVSNDISMDMNRIFEKNQKSRDDGAR
jgi:hypothetical protein